MGVQRRRGGESRCWRHFGGWVRGWVGDECVTGKWGVARAFIVVWAVLIGNEKSQTKKKEGTNKAAN